nr:MAG TPA: hypothetical protein [Crassvirales sp.]
MPLPFFLQAISLSFKCYTKISKFSYIKNVISIILIYSQ